MSTRRPWITPRRIRPTAARIEVLTVAAVGLLMLGAAGLSTALSSDTGAALTRNTIRMSLAGYAAAVLLMMRFGSPDWQAATGTGRAARLSWTWGVVCFVLHLAMAFHFYHGWSPARAVDHTREVSGLGEGIYASYLFTWLWTGDAAWWWISPRHYAARSAWIRWTLHAFMLFIVFNGVIVFETGSIRWTGVVMLAAIATVWLVPRLRPKLQPA